jgi:NADPH:quinone reductase-like Zn-dependent oxidoreductase
MKAIVYHQYGSPDVLKLEEVEKPTSKDNEVLIKIHAASVNLSDWEGLRGKPLYARMGGLLTPGNKILGSDIAGTVEAVGKNARRFKPGDEVFGLMLNYGGGFAEYACKSEKALALKPAGMTFEQAAAIPQAAFIALQGIREKGQVKQGQKVLINGAGGGAGSLAIQLAKLAGAEVTGVDNAEKLELMRSLGATRVIDYRKEDFTKNGQQYDLILDMVAYRSVFAYKRSLAPDGKCFVVGGSLVTFLQILLFGSWIGRSAGKKISMLLVLPTQKDLASITELYESGKVLPVIDKVFPFSETPEAIRYLGEGHVKGKIVITLEINSKDRGGLAQNAHR